MYPESRKKPRPSGLSDYPYKEAAADKVEDFAAPQMVWGIPLYTFASLLEARSTSTDAPVNVFGGFVIGCALSDTAPTAEPDTEFGFGALAYDVYMSEAFGTEYGYAPVEFDNMSDSEGLTADSMDSSTDFSAVSTPMPFE